MIGGRKEWTWRKGYKRREPTYHRHVRCPSCATRVGVRFVRDGMKLLAAHSVGKARIVDGHDECDSSRLNIAEAA